MPRIREDVLVTPTLLRRFELEAEFEQGDQRYYALMQRDNGDWLCHHPGSPSLDPAQMMWATEALRLLNRELHHDGAWVIVFTDPAPPQMPTALHEPSKHWMYRRYALIWVDADGDPQFTQEWVAGSASDFGTWADVVLAGVHSTAEKCAHSWALWHTAMREVLDPKPDQLIKKAQGQRASVARH